MYTEASLDEKSQRIKHLVQQGNAQEALVAALENPPQGNTAAHLRVNCASHVTRASKQTSKQAFLLSHCLLVL